MGADVWRRSTNDNRNEGVKRQARKEWNGRDQEGRGKVIMLPKKPQAEGEGRNSADWGGFQFRGNLNAGSWTDTTRLDRLDRGSRPPERNKKKNQITRDRAGKEDRAPPIAPNWRDSKQWTMRRRVKEGTTN